MQLLQFWRLYIQRIFVQMNNAPLVTVVVVSYNHEKYIEECILSIIAQDYSNIELVVVDDCSTDATFKIAKELAKKYEFSAYRNPCNLGLVKTLNNTLKNHVSGDYFTFLASDDVMTEKSIYLRVKMLLEDTHASAVFGDSVLIDTDSRVIRKPYNYFMKMIRRFNARNLSLNKILTYNLVPAGSLMIKVSDMFDIGLYDCGVFIEDFTIIVKLLMHGKKFKYCQKDLYKYRYHYSSDKMTVLASGNNRILVELKDLLYLLQKKKLLDQKPRDALLYWHECYFHNRVPSLIGCIKVILYSRSFLLVFYIFLTMVRKGSLNRVDRVND